MNARRMWWRRLMVPLVVCAMSVATVGIAVPTTATAAGPVAVKTVPVQQLSSIVMKLIKNVEGSTLPCETRNDVVRRLRLLDDALLSGRRSAAQALALAWRQDAWSMMAARLIGPELGSSIQNRLGRMQGKIGSGYAVKPGPTRHWKPLPGCETSPSGGESVVASGAGTLASASGDVVGSYTPTIADPLADLKIFLKAGLGLLNLVNLVLPGVGTILSSLLSGVVDLFWPQGTGTNTANLFQDLVDATTYNMVKNDVEKLGGQLQGSPGAWNENLAAWQYKCQHTHGGFDTDGCAGDARGLYGQWSTIYGQFLGLRSAVKGAGDQVELLPLFAASENLFLPFLSQGVQLHQYWKADPSKGWSALDDTLVNGSLVAIPFAAMDEELDPSYVDRGIGYVNAVYKTGLDQQPAASTPEGWATRNAWIRDMTLNVLDFRDMWKFQDPRAYPAGVPGGAKLTRMIYSDPVGEMQATPTPPVNVPGPLKELSVWRKQVQNDFLHTEYESDYGITSVQATSPPLLGPAQSGAVRGDVTPALNANSDLKNPKYYDLAAHGPITAIETDIDRPQAGGDFFPSWIKWTFADGWQNSVGRSPQIVSDPPGYHVWQFGGEVLATAHVISHFKSAWVGWPMLADAIVFGFRYADSFGPSGAVIGAGSGKCVRVPLPWTNGKRAEIYTCARPPAQDQIWTYDPGLQQISVSDPAVNPADNTNNVQGKYCLAAANGSTALHTPVVIIACDDGAVTYDTAGNPVVSSQRWTMEATGAGIGKIINVKSGLVIDVPNNSTANATGLQLDSYVGGAGQHWHASDPLTGEIHALGSGRCLEVPNNSSTPGTQVQILDCLGNWAQQWTYKPASKELVYAYAPSMCLEARGGGTTAGTAVQIGTCTGAAEQKWTLAGNGGIITNDKSGLLLSVVGKNTDNQTLVNLDNTKYTANQGWSRTSSQGGLVFSLGAAGKCLDLPASTWTNGTQAVIRTCLSPLSASQTWTYHQIAQTFTVESPSGPKCLAAAGAVPTAGAAVVITDCTPAASQRWVRNFGSSTITNVATITDDDPGLVLDLAGAGSDGTPLQLSPPGKPIPASQQWVWSLS